MNCNQVQDLAAALVDDEQLASIELDQVRTHLSECRTCAYEYEMDRLTSRIVRTRVPIVQTPFETYHSIITAIEQE